MELKVNRGVGLVFIIVIGAISITCLIAALRIDTTTEQGILNRWSLIGIGIVPPFLFGLAIVGNYLWLYSVNRKEKYFEQYGKPGVATVISCYTTGAELNNLAQVELKLSIEKDDELPYTVTHREYFDPITANTFFSGLRLRVLIDPRNKRKIFINGD